MKILILFAAFVIGACLNYTLADDKDTFDVPNGSFRTLASGALAPNTLISCDVSVDESYFGPEWIPSVAIIFKGPGESDETSVNMKLSASRSNADENWRHKLLINDGNGRESLVTAHTGFSDSVLPLNLLWDDDQYIVFYLDEIEDMSVLDISPHALATWQAVVSGVKGSGDCDSLLLRKDDKDGTTE
jgi:hypothetical protein